MMTLALRLLVVGLVVFGALSLMVSRVDISEVPMVANDTEEQRFESTAATPLQKSVKNNTGIWEGVKQGEWLHGPCPLKAVAFPDNNDTPTGDIEVYPWNGSLINMYKEKLITLNPKATVTTPCWGDDNMMVCSSCCDGKMMSCAGHFDVKKWNRRFRRQVTNFFPAALYKGEFYSINNTYLPRTGMKLSGIPASDLRHFINPENCTVYHEEPLLLLKNGDWTRGTSSNVAHWLGEIMGVILGALHTYNVKKVQLLIPNCPISRPGPTKQCKTFPVQFDELDYSPHLKATPFSDGTDWVFALARRYGIPWIVDTTVTRPLPKNPDAVVCFKKVIWGCPTPKACPTPKYLASIMPFYQHFLGTEYALSYTPTLPKKRIITILTRQPGGSRYIANHEKMADMVVEVLGESWMGRTLPMWKASGAYNEILKVVQESSVIVSMHGADLALAQTFMKKKTAIVEILLEHARREDPFYVFQANGATLSTVRWTLPASSIPEWREREAEKQFNGTVKYNNNISWRRQAINFTLPLHSWKTVLKAARIMVEN